MKYAAIIDYTPDKAKTAEARPAHRKYLTDLYDAGKLAIAGPFGDDSGAIIVYETETPEQADELLKKDPFHAAGVFVKWTIKPWKTVFISALPPGKPT